jgi:malic enzyme
MQLRADDLYLGWRQPRLRGAEYDSLVDEFVQAVKKRFPRALLQWEDFKKQNAFNLLERYRNNLPSFNDDIQGTAAVAVAGILAAGRATNTPIAQQRIVILGGGAAGVGIATQIRSLMKQTGVTGAALTKSIAILDSGGLLIQGRDLKEAAKRELAWPNDIAASIGFTPEKPGNLLDIVSTLKPTVLIGASGIPGTFTEQVVREMGRHVGRPAIFPFSNPTSKSEAIPADIIEWTQGRALVATGSPFAPVNYAGRTIRIGQGNNVYIFPGVGLGALVSDARVITDEMFTAAAQTLADSVSESDLESGALYPRLTELRNISAKIAHAVVRIAREQGVGRDISDEQIPSEIAKTMWTPEYPALRPM